VTIPTDTKGKEEAREDSGPVVDPEVAALQTKYLELEAQFIQELGLGPEDLPTGYTQTKPESASGSKKR